MAMIEVLGTRTNRGVGDRGPPGTVTVDLVIRSPELGRLPVSVTVEDQGDATGTLEAVRSKLLDFAEGLRGAAQVPLG
jgi:hypothetical protein